MNISSLALLLFCFKVAVNWPQTFSEFVLGPNNVQLGFLIRALNGVAMASGIAVTSAPVSILNVIGTSFKCSSTSHSVVRLFVECIVPKNALSDSSGISLVIESIVYLDLH